ncbi:MAG: hypothetical protein CMI09_14125 [Oceanospirillaceae bacterium]|nr:hypothetical protein [Oceanospirillaceae bacterium]
MPRKVTDKAFVQQRQRFNSSWPMVGAILLLVVMGMGIGLAMSYPIMANPLYVISQLQAGQLDESTLETAAILLPIVFWMLIICLLLFVMLGWQMMNNEKRLLKILASQQR